MSATQDDDQDPSDETIFKGMKFWVARRVPTRGNIVGLINTHGGDIVLLDKKADILIADHARKDCPPDSFSWRFVVDSAKEGRLLDMEPYRINQPSIAPRPTASGEPTRTQRTPYTPADDALLASWAHADKNNRGNKIYQELAAAHPHHSWQSWRDRWVKRLRYLPDNTLKQMVSSLEPNVQATAPAAPATPGTRPQRQAVPPAIPSPTHRKSQQVSPAVREESPNFNDDDDALLEKYVKDKVGSGERWNSISVYEGLSKNHPHHSAESWKNRFATLWREDRVSMKDWNSTSRRSPVHQKSDTRSAEAGSRAGDEAISPAREGESPERDAMSSSQESAVCESDDPKNLFYSYLRVWLDTEAEAGRTWDVAKWHRVQGRNFELQALYEAVLAQKCPIEDVDWDLVAETMAFDWLSFPHTAGELEGCWDKYLARFHDDTAGFEFDDTEAPEGETHDVPSRGDTPVLRDDEVPEEEAHDVSCREGTPAPRDNNEARDEEANDVSSREGTPARGHDTDAPDEEAHAISYRENTPTPRSVRSPSLSDRAPPVSQPQKRRLGRDTEILSTPEGKLRPGSARRGHDNITPSKRRRFDENDDERGVDSATVEDEDIYNATPTHRRPVRQKAPRSRSPTARALAHQRPTASGGGYSSTVPPKRTRHYENGGERGVASASVGSEDIHSATPTHRRPVRRGAHPSPSPAASLRAHSKPTTPGGAGMKSGRHTERHSRPVVPTTISSQRPAARRRALPPDVRREPDAQSPGDDESAVPAVRRGPNVRRTKDGGSAAPAGKDRDPINQVIERFVRQGYSRDVVAEGLYRTSFMPALAGSILASLNTGEGVPAGLKGVWTESDDEKLKTVDAVDMNRPTENVAQQNQRARVKKMNEELVKKHGKTNVELRRRVLRDAGGTGFTL